MASVLSSQGPFHAVNFFERLEDLCSLVEEFVSSGAGGAVLIVACPEHRSAIVETLNARGFDWRSMESAGRWTVLDADTTLNAFMVDGHPDAERFAASVGARVAAATADPEVPLRIYGEMVNLLWGRGQRTAALELEALWNRLAATHAFALLCGYAAATVRDDQGLASIDAQHSHALSVLGPPAMPYPAP